MHSLEILSSLILSMDRAELYATEGIYIHQIS